MRGRARRQPERQGQKKFKRISKKPLDKKQILCYNKDVRKREGNS